MTFDVERIKSKIDTVVLADTEISDTSGLEIDRLNKALEFAKVMATCEFAIPAFMRGNPGDCGAAVTRAVRWGVDPYFVAEMLYLVENPRTGEKKIAAMSQLVNAVINAKQKFILEGKLRCRYEGEGDNMRCIVFGVPKGEKEPLEVRSPTLGDRKKAIGRNEKGHLRGSPLYDTDPEQQMWYYTSRAFIKRYFPEVLAGVVTAEDIAEEGMRDVTPVAPPSKIADLSNRLKQARIEENRRGFDPEHVNREALGLAAGSGTYAADLQENVDDKESDGTARGDSAGIQAATGSSDDSSERNPDDSGASEPSGSTDREVGGDAAGNQNTEADQGSKPKRRAK